MITQEYLKSILSYDPDTGLFTRLRRSDRSKQWNTRYAGKTAGYEWSPDDSNVTYWMISIDGRPYGAHRLAVLWMTGCWPEDNVDHEDLDGTNNRWVNIRGADHTQNGYNRGCNKNSKTGIKGVSPYKGRFRATIQANGVWKQIGVFDTIQQAAAARRIEAQRLHAEFARH